MHTKHLFEVPRFFHSRNTALISQKLLCLLLPSLVTVLSSTAALRQLAAGAAQIAYKRQAHECPPAEPGWSSTSSLPHTSAQAKLLGRMTWRVSPSCSQPFRSQLQWLAESSTQAAGYRMRNLGLRARSWKFPQPCDTRCSFPYHSHQTCQEAALPTGYQGGSGQGWSLVPVWRRKAVMLWPSWKHTQRAASSRACPNSWILLKPEETLEIIGITSFGLLDKENIQAFIPAFLRCPWLKNCINCSSTKLNLQSDDHYSSKGRSFFLLQQVNKYTIFQVMSSIFFAELNLCMPELLRNHLVPDACKELCCGQARWCSLTRSTTSAYCSSLWYLQDSQKSLCCFAACWSWLGRSENFIKCFIKDAR